MPPRRQTRTGKETAHTAPTIATQRYNDQQAIRVSRVLNSTNPNSHHQPKQSRQVPLSPSSNMSGNAPRTQTMVVVTVWFACGHSQERTVPFDLDVSPAQFVMRTCHSAACQAIPMALHLRPRATLDDQSSGFITEMHSQLTLVGLNVEGALRTFSHVEPILPEDIAALGYGPDLVEALTRCGRLERTQAVERTQVAHLYLQHRIAKAMLEELRSVFILGGPHWLARQMSVSIATFNGAIQHRLIALQQAVFHLEITAYPAPGAPFHRHEGIQSHQPSWGKRQIATLRQSDEGNAILGKTLNIENILAAKACMRKSENELEMLFEAERASFFADYPGMAYLHAAGLIKPTDEMLQELSASDSDSDTAMSDASSFVEIGQDNGVQCPGPDIREIRPQNRVASRKMAQNKLTLAELKVRAPTTSRTV
ncbi:hypothetical protein Q7P37_009516 [Cladosporium fusiforme]